MPDERHVCTCGDCDDGADRCKHEANLDRLAAQVAALERSIDYWRPLAQVSSEGARAPSGALLEVVERCEAMRARAETAEAELAVRKDSWAREREGLLDYGRRLSDDRTALKLALRAAEGGREPLMDALRFYARQRGLGAVLASDGGRLARETIAEADR